MPQLPHRVANCGYIMQVTAKRAPRAVSTKPQPHTAGKLAGKPQASVDGNEVSSLLLLPLSLSFSLCLFLCCVLLDLFAVAARLLLKCAALLTHTHIAHPSMRFQPGKATTSTIDWLGQGSYPPMHVQCMVYVNPHSLQVDVWVHPKGHQRLTPEKHTPRTLSPPPPTLKPHYLHGSPPAQPGLSPQASTVRGPNTPHPPIMRAPAPGSVHAQYPISGPNPIFVRCLGDIPLAPQTTNSGMPPASSALPRVVTAPGPPMPLLPTCLLYTSPSPRD